MVSFQLLEFGHVDVAHVLSLVEALIGVLVVELGLVAARLIEVGSGRSTYLVWGMWLCP